MQNESEKSKAVKLRESWALQFSFLVIAILLIWLELQSDKIHGEIIQKLKLFSECLEENVINKIFYAQP